MENFKTLIEQIGIIAIAVATAAGASYVAVLILHYLP